MPPQRNKGGAFVDEVWQSVLYQPPQSSDPDQQRFAHQAGAYQKDPTLGDTALGHLGYFSPTLASSMSATDGEGYFATWGPQAHVPNP